MKRALITGSLGQDGSYLSEHLLKLGYEVWGTVRMLPELHSNYVKGVNYVYADLSDDLSIAEAIRKSQPHEIYNLAGQTFVPTSWSYPHQTLDVNAGGLARVLECVELMGLPSKIYQASTSEMFGNVMTSSQAVSLDENCPMNPVSPYGVSKYAAHKLVDAYRQRGMYVVSGILFNHESPRRGTEMVTRKITRHIATWCNGSDDVLELGAITKRDWGYAGDYVVAMHLMLQQERAEDFVIGTGEAHSIEDFVYCALKAAKLSSKYGELVRYDCAQFGRRPELHTLVADYHKAKNILNWKPVTSFESLVLKMVNADCSRILEMKNV